MASIDSIDRLGIIFGVVVAIGAVGLAYVAIDHWRLGAQLQRLDAEEKRAHEAVIASANERAAKATERAEEANKIAEGERLARLKIEERLRWRNLTIEQQKAIAAKVSVFRGQRISVLSMIEREADEVAHQIWYGSLQHAGWVASPRPDDNEARSVTGMRVEVTRSASMEAKAAAKTLVDALLAENMSVDGPVETDAFASPQDASATMRLIVGSR